MDRKQAAEDYWDVAINIAIVAVLAYAVLDVLGIALHDVLLVGGGIGVLVVALLVARGMYLIGSGTDAEYQARAKAADVPGAATGFALLDWLRTADLPFLKRIERRLGRTREQTVHCNACRKVWVHDTRHGRPQCPNCGTDDFDVLG